MTATMVQAGLETTPPAPAPELFPHVGHLAFGWCDPERKVSTARKCAEALKAYRAKYGRDPLRIMTSVVDAPEETEIDGIPVSGRCYVSAGTFYLLLSEGVSCDPF